MQMTVHDGVYAVAGCCCHGSAGWLMLFEVPLRSISGTRASGSVDGSPCMFSGRLGPSPSGFSRCASPSGGAGPVSGGRSTGTTPVAYAAAQPSTFCAYGIELL